MKRTKAAPKETRTDYQEMANHFSLIPLNGKVPIEKNWTEWCKTKREYKVTDFSNSQNVGVCCGPASGILVLDIDDPQKFRTSRMRNKWKLPETYQVETGGGGSHYYFRYPKDNRKYGNKSLQNLGFDIRGDGGQVVAEGSTHPDTGKLYQRSNGSTPSDISDAPDWLLGLYEEKPKKEEGRKEAWDGDFDSLAITKRVKSLINSKIPSGERSEAEITVLNALVGAGLSDDAIKQIFNNYPIGERARERGGSHLQDQIAKARGYSTPAQKENKVFLGDIIERLACPSTEFLARKHLQPPRVLIQPIIREQSLSMVFAPAGVGKSWFIHTIALGLTRKEYEEVEIGPWLIKQPCGVLLVDGEMPAGLLRERIRALALPMGPEDPEHPFLIFTAEEAAVESNAQVNLTKEDWRNLISGFLQKRSEIRLLILDNISSLVPGGDENTKGSWDPVNQWLLSLRRQGVAVILVHHAGKGGDYRGHSGRIDNLDNVIQLAPKGTADEVKFEIRLSKARCLRPGEGTPFGLQLAEWDEDPTCMIWQDLNLQQDRKREIQAAILRCNSLKKDIAKDFGISPGRVSQHISELKQQGLFDPKGKITKKGIDFLRKLEEQEEEEEL